MNNPRFVRLPSLLAPMLLCLALPAPVRAQVSDIVVVGVTPTCPYGIAACAVGAREGLQRLEGVTLVAEHPDRYNCTFDVQYEDGGLPDIDKWRAQFKAVVGDAFVFRGVEMTVTGTVVEADGAQMLKAEGLKQPLRLAPLEHKLQWNFRKVAAREPEPSESDAYRRLVSAHRETLPAALKVDVTGPLRLTRDGPVVEVREFFVSKDP